MIYLTSTEKNLIATQYGTPIRYTNTIKGSREIELINVYNVYSASCIIILLWHNPFTTEARFYVLNAMTFST